MTMPTLPPIMPPELVGRAESIFWDSEMLARIGRDFAAILAPLPQPERLRAAHLLCSLILEEIAAQEGPAG